MLHDALQRQIFPRSRNKVIPGENFHHPQYVPEIKIKDLSQIVLETIASLNAMQKKKDRLIEITVDGKISADEIGDFVFIQQELEKISVAVETLQLWCERMIDNGVIDRDIYRRYKESGS
ncbi:MAG: hypothetical protein IKU58_05230 [Clostridia bacterium]|nr:hypothetical protein [Clostridia bacterium]